MRPEEEPEYTRMDAQIYYMLACLDKEGPVGGRKLSETTGIGEAAVKEIAAAMRDCGWTTVSSAGMRLSEKGAEVLRNIPIELVGVKGSEHVMGGHQRGVLIRGMAHAVMNGARQRDMGTSAGAHGASVFTMRSGDLMMYRCNMDIRDPLFAREIRNKGMDEGDVMIICGADDPNTAAVSAIFAALDLFSDRGKKRRKASPPPSAENTAARAEEGEAR
ncbi:MAG: hypothetical protein FWH47_01900 [Methanomassiliicoccaceae archaeon]|nr:hypothetical protein [Methanomassiliicoccaceae archaeon]